MLSGVCILGVPSPNLALCWLRHVFLSSVSCRPSCLQASVMGLRVPRLSQAQTGLPCPLPASLSYHSALGPSSLGVGWGLAPPLLLPQPHPGEGGASWELKPSSSSSSTFAAHRHSPAFPLASFLLVTLLRAALGSGAHGRCPGIARAVAGMTGDTCCSVSASAWSPLRSTGVSPRGAGGPPLRPAGAGAQSLMGGCPSLAREGGREGKWVEPGREKSQPFELPRQHPLGPQETAPQMSLPEARAGGGGGCLTPATLMLAV